MNIRAFDVKEHFCCKQQQQLNKTSRQEEINSQTFIIKARFCCLDLFAQPFQEENELHLGHLRVVYETSTAEKIVVEKNSEETRAHDALVFGRQRVAEADRMKKLRYFVRRLIIVDEIVSDMRDNLQTCSQCFCADQ